MFSRILMCTSTRTTMSVVSVIELLSSYVESIMSTTIQAYYVEMHNWISFIIWFCNWIMYFLSCLFRIRIRLAIYSMRSERSRLLEFFSTESALVNFHRRPAYKCLFATFWAESSWTVASIMFSSTLFTYHIIFTFLFKQLLL